jgi:hypothetical protein
MAKIEQLPGVFDIKIIKGDSFSQVLLIDGVDGASTMAAGFTDGDIDVVIPITTVVSEGADPDGSFRIQIDVSSTISDAVSSTRCRWFLSATLAGVKRTILVGDLSVGGA